MSEHPSGKEILMIEIAKAEEKHLPEISRLWQEFARFHADIEPIFEPHNQAVQGHEKEVVRRSMDSGNGLVLVALDGEEVVGFSVAEIREPPRGMKRGEYGYISEMAVTAEYRRTGIGEKMFAEIMKWFRSRGIDRIELEITSRNIVSASFWGKQGFTEYKRKLYRQI
jgi:ribosomal protein S18 acetylase RimI-like enzyme